MPCSQCEHRSTTSAGAPCPACTGQAAAAAPAAPAAPVTTLTPTPAPPPGVVGSGVLRSPVGLGRAAMILLLLVAVAYIARITAELNMRRLVAGVLDDGFVAVSEADAAFAELMLNWAETIRGNLLLATMVVFIIWFHRVRCNAGVFATDWFTNGTGMAIGSWFIPIGNLWIPRRVAVETWTASRADHLAGSRHQPTTLLNVWWTGWVATLLLSAFAAWRGSRAETADEMLAAVDLMVAADAVAVVAAVLAILFVRRLTHMQHTKALALSQTPRTV
ncbi:DUF4328 domain-containing protein [Streptomyces sp. C10-9-1]|uniref:DUF4328 domain-containing protein n=1 Tax=Streptomyces sp. C10-9-1 TaxID=1859285 RepID=UPI003D72F75B